MAELKDQTMTNLILVVGAIVSFVFTILTFAFGADIALYTMAVKSEIFWQSEYGYSDWNVTSGTGTTETLYKEKADIVETESIDAMMSAVSAVGIAGSLITLVLVALVFFRKSGGLIYMFKDAGN